MAVLWPKTYAMYQYIKVGITWPVVPHLYDCGVLKLNTMQLETPSGNHCCLMANDVYN